MKNLKLRKLVAVALAVMTISTVSPIGASAAWKQDSNGWWNTEGGSWSIGWRNINGSWYNFGSDGYMKTGWVNDGGTWYFTAPSGEMKTGWVNDGGTWYFTAASGAMQTGWVNDGGTWYFTAASGAMQTGVVEVGGKVYYLAPSGAMATGTVVINGTTYNFAQSGEAVGDKIPTPAVAFAGNGAQQTPTTTGTTTPTTTDTTTGTTTSSGGGGGSSSGGTSGGSTPVVNPPVVTPSDMTNEISSTLVTILPSHDRLKNNIEVMSTNPFVIKLKKLNSESLESIFNTATGRTEAEIEARLNKALGIMNSNSQMLEVGGVSFATYLSNAEDRYLNTFGGTKYFDSNHVFNTSTIAHRIYNGGSYLDFKQDLNNRVTAMGVGTETTPEITISYGILSETVTKIEKTGTGTIYAAGSSIGTNINGLLNLGNITGTYTIYCDNGSKYFIVTVTTGGAI